LSSPQADNLEGKLNLARFGEAQARMWLAADQGKKKNIYKIIIFKIKNN